MGKGIPVLIHSLEESIAELRTPVQELLIAFEAAGEASRWIDGRPHVLHDGVYVEGVEEDCCDGFNVGGEGWLDGVRHYSSLVLLRRN